MAKSKVGGSRAYIRGRIGADVYSVGKDGKGARQQVVRSLAEQVSNPRTESQMFGRMIMSTTMQAVSAFKPIIDHSFDGLPSGQPSISEFIRLNYALIKADANAHPASGNKFGLVKYQEKGVKVGEYKMSKGSAVVPSAVSISAKTLTIALTADTMTVGGLKTALGLASEGYITALYLAENAGFVYVRIQVNTSLGDSTAITAENVASIFAISGNKSVTPSVYQNNINFEIDEEDNNYAEGLIVSDKVDGSWIHSECTLSLTGDAAFVSDVALPTYPTGAAQFLNGGDL